MAGLIFLLLIVASMVWVGYDAKKRDWSYKKHGSKTAAGQIIGTSASIGVAAGATVTGIAVSTSAVLAGAAAGGAAAAGAAAAGAGAATAGISTAVIVTTAAAAAGVAGAVAVAKKGDASPSR